MKISVIITTFNEGDEVAATIDSIRENTKDYEIVLVDDASTDGSCDKVRADQYIKNDERIGIAPSRRAGISVARGDTFAFLDAHQRVSKRCLNKCADIALERQAITWPCVTGLGDSKWLGHGATMTQKEQRKGGLFCGRWKHSKPMDEISRSGTMIVPGYVIPRSVYPKVELIPGLSNHGASEPALTVKAFFTDVDILHVCGPVAKHLFRDGSKLPFKCPWAVTSMNHALVARVCFSQITWEEYWYPYVFKKHLKTDEAKAYINSGEVMKWHRDFQKIKVRPDNEFWTGLILDKRKGRGMPDNVSFST